MNTKESLQIALLYTAFFSLIFVTSIFIRAVDPTGGYIFVFVWVAFVCGLAFFLKEAKKEQKTQEPRKVE